MQVAATISVRPKERSRTAEQHARTVAIARRRHAVAHLRTINGLSRVVRSRWAILQIVGLFCMNDFVSFESFAIAIAVPRIIAAAVVGDDHARRCALSNARRSTPVYHVIHPESLVDRVSLPQSESACVNEEIRIGVARRQRAVPRAQTRAELGAVRPR